MSTSQNQEQLGEDGESSSSVAESTLSKTETHDKWVSEYRNSQNQLFYNLAFDRIAKIVTPTSGSKTLDAGCGSATKSIHLAKRNFNVIAVDLADTVLTKAESEVRNENLQDKIKIQQDNLTDLSFEDEYFDHVLCWGVLMHIPDVENAIKELCRVTKPGGYIIISEVNMYSIQAIFLRVLKKILGKGRARINKTQAGLEAWEETSVGKLMTRETNMQWLVSQFSKNGAKLERRTAGQFSELYIMDLPSWVKLIIHAINNFWFKYIKLPGPSFGNLLLFKKAS